MGTAQKLILFGSIPQKKLNVERITEGENQIVPCNLMLHPDLPYLVTALDTIDEKSGNPRDWWIARVECLPEQIKMSWGDWYRARENIVVPDGWKPLEDALVSYAGIDYSR